MKQRETQNIRPVPTLIELHSLERIASLSRALRRKSILSSQKLYYFKMTSSELNNFRLIMNQ